MDFSAETTQQGLRVPFLEPATETQSRQQPPAAGPSGEGEEGEGPIVGAERFSDEVPAAEYSPPAAE